MMRKERVGRVDRKTTNMRMVHMHLSIDQWYTKV